MRRFGAMLIIIFALTLLLTGCANWMSSEYLWIQPHEEQDINSGEQLIAVDSYTQLRNELKRLIGEGAEEVVISAANFNDTSIDFYVSTAVNYILDNTAIGAYAVDKISYEIGTNRGEPVVAFMIDYKHDSSEIKDIKHISGNDEIFKEIEAALDACETSVVVFTNHYEPIELTKFISSYANENPDKIMEVPHSSFVTYPATGDERIVEITLTYLTDKQTLLEMQRQVQAVFTSAELYVKGTGKVIDVYSRLYSFLMERSEYIQGTSVTPTYSLLHEGKGDSIAFANVYAAMCKKSGLECNVVSGMREGETWTWNVLRYRGRYYHVDLLRCSENGIFEMADGKDMEGYDWDITQYPIN